MRRLFLFFLLCVMTIATGTAQDWANTQRYADDNRRLLQTANDGHRVVLMGNSITEYWEELCPQVFTDNRLVGRGISGQTSAQMLARFRADVLDLAPRVVVILAGTNDIAENLGHYCDTLTQNNIASMVELARLHHITVVLASVLPADRFYWRPTVTDVPGKIKRLNAWIEQFALERNLTFVNFYPLLEDPVTHGLRTEFTDDGVHPNRAGYAVMQSLLLPVVDMLR